MRVLVVEDERGLVGALQKSLRDEGYAVDVAEDGEEGLYKATSWDYDAVILDIMLPKRDGWDVLRRIRRSKKIPVLMLTARDALEDRIRGLDGGADEYLVKPFELEELHARLRALIRRSARQANPVIKIGEITIDTASRTVERARREVVLTAREYSLELAKGLAACQAELLKGIDTNGDGAISADELAAIDSRRAGKLKALDTDGDGAVSAAELAANVDKRKAEILAKLDTNGDGTISADELAAYQPEGHDRPSWHGRSLRELDTNQWSHRPGGAGEGSTRVHGHEAGGGSR